MEHLRRLTIISLSSIAGLGWFLAGCGGPRPPAGDVQSKAGAPSAATAVLGPEGACQTVDRRPGPGPETPSGPFRFIDILADSGVDFVHVSGMTATKQFPTANGSG